MTATTDLRAGYDPDARPPADQDLRQMSDDGGPAGPDPARWADPAWRDGPPAGVTPPSTTYADLVRLEGALARDPDPDGPAGPGAAAALRLAPERTTGHALGVARGDLAAIEDTARGSFTGRTAPEGGDVLVVADGR